MGTKIKSISVIIPVYNSAIKNNETNWVEGYWQRRGKSSARRQVRKFFIAGVCKYRGQVINTEERLAYFFDPQIIGDIKRRLHIHRNWWETTAQVHEEPAPIAVPFVKKIRSKRIQLVSYNICSAYDRLEATLDLYCMADIFFIQSTCLRAPQRDTKARHTYSHEKRNNFTMRTFHIFWGIA